MELGSDLSMQCFLVALLLRRSLRLHVHYGVVPLLLELTQHRPLLVPGGGVAGLAVAIRLLQSSTPRPERQNGVTWRMNAEPLAAVGSIEPLKILSSHTSSSRSGA
jgi:hypothetical protein